MHCIWIFVFFPPVNLQSNWMSGNTHSQPYCFTACTLVSKCNFREHLHQPTISVSSQVNEQTSDQNNFQLGLFALATCRWNLSRQSRRVPEVLRLSGAGTLDLNPAQSMDVSLRFWVGISDRAWSKNNRRRSIFSVLSICGGAVATLLVSVYLTVF